MSNNPMTGEETDLDWTPDGGSLINLSTFGRNYEPEETADVYDTTTYAEAQAGARTYIPGLRDGKAKFQVMYQKGDTTVYPSLVPGTVGELVNHPEGKVATKPRETVTAIITKRSRPQAYDGVMVVEVEWQFSGPVVYDAVPSTP